VDYMARCDEREAGRVHQGQYPNGTSGQWQPGRSKGRHDISVAVDLIQHWASSSQGGRGVLERA
jgi:hypothetical protein